MPRKKSTAGTHRLRASATGASMVTAHGEGGAGQQWRPAGGALEAGQRRRQKQSRAAVAWRVAAEAVAQAGGFGRTGKQRRWLLGLLGRWLRYI
ncbi:hypothetical protein E2562_008667 [Oryza meyeriana var. granulata]|uniref:Uncharacterized protein n=1 Tax=Oryza meyeriana var. granulata TaxID=110450 RepID=A0A6G1F5I8_9ORYZ|nr:hypothetical protein E2562_008667 [Oryza meyeriana var. granulata]